MNTTTTEAAAPAVAERTPQLMLVEGNEAAALGVALARPDMVAVYPITPQTSLVEKLAKLIADGGMDADIVDAEGEHSVLSVLQGSALAGGRTYTATCGPGLAFMFEPYFRAAYHHMWEEPKKMDDPEVFRTAFLSSGIDIDRLIARAQELAAQVKSAEARAREAGRALFDAVYERWSARPADARPELLFFGVSLGSFSKLMPPKPGLAVQVIYQGLPGTPMVAVQFK